MPDDDRAALRPAPLLSDHERCVIWLAAQGLSIDEIGQQLGMSPLAVQALAYALRRVLQDPIPA